MMHRLCCHEVVFKNPEHAAVLMPGLVWRHRFTLLRWKKKKSPEARRVYSLQT